MGREIWQVEGIKRAGLLATDNIKVDLQGIEKRILSFVQDRGRCWKLQNLMIRFPIPWRFTLILSVAKSPARFIPPTCQISRSIPITYIVQKNKSKSEVL